MTDLGWRVPTPPWDVILHGHCWGCDTAMRFVLSNTDQLPLHGGADQTCPLCGRTVECGWHLAPPAEEAADGFYDVDLDTLRTVIAARVQAAGLHPTVAVKAASLAVEAIREATEAAAGLEPAVDPLTQETAHDDR